MNGLDLFSGIGGMSYALQEWVRPIAYCEIDPYCQAVLLSRMVKSALTNAPIWDDIKTLKSEAFRGNVDIIYGGFPCQDISIAGAGKGLEGERSGLFYEVVRLAKEIKPKFLFLENVPAIRSRGGLRVVSEITHMGYDCRWCVISASSLGACHKRERWFLLAHANGEGLEGFGQRASGIATENSKPSNSNSSSSDSRCTQQRSEEESERSSDHTSRLTRIWETEPPICLLDDGVSHRVDKLRALGNAVVPCQAREAFKILMGLK